MIAELRGRQEDMDLFISSGEDLQRELVNVPHCGSNSIQRGMDTLRDQWLQVRELGWGRELRVSFLLGVDGFVIPFGGNRLLNHNLSLFLFTYLFVCLSHFLSLSPPVGFSGLLSCHK